MDPKPRPAAGPGASSLLLGCALLALSLPGLAQQTAPQALRDLEQRPSGPAWMGIRAAPGVHVQEVIPGGPAERAGLKDGDLITGVDGVSAIGESGLMGVLREKGPGEVIELDVVRAGEDLVLKLELGEFPADLLAERLAVLAKEKRRGASALAPTPPPSAPRPDVPALTGAGAFLTHAGQEERAFLGVRLQELTSGLATFLGLPPDSPGVLIEHVHEDSPAGAAGLKAGDVLLSVEGRQLHDMTQLGELLRGRSPGEEINLVWWSRTEKEKSATVRLSARNKDIWVVSPPDREQQRLREKVRESLESRLRMLEEQRRSLEYERDSVQRNLEKILAEAEKR